MQTRHQRTFFPITRWRIVPLVKILLQRSAVEVNVIFVKIFRRRQAQAFVDVLHKRDDERRRLITPLDFVVFKRIKFQSEIDDLPFDVSSGERDH